MSNNQSNLTGTIRNTIYDVLAEEANLLSTFDWEIVDFDLDNQTATLRFNATMKEYAAGSKLQFCAAWTKVDDTEGKTDGDWVEGPNFQSEITLPLNHNTVISIRVEDADGNIKEQVIQTPLYELHPDNFHLYARNLTTPFAITTKGFGITSQTAKAEQAKAERAAAEKKADIEKRFADCVGDKTFSHDAIKEAYLKDRGFRKI